MIMKIQSHVHSLLKYSFFKMGTDVGAVGRKKHKTWDNGNVHFWC